MKSQTKLWLEIIVVVCTLIGALVGIGNLFFGGDGIIGSIKGEDNSDNSVTPPKPSELNINIENNPINQSTNDISQATEIQKNQDRRLNSDLDLESGLISEVDFYCGLNWVEDKAIPATIVKSPSYNQPVTVISWNPDNDYFGEDWPPQKRCEVVSERFQRIYNRDRLNYITVDTAAWIAEQKIYVICAVKDTNTETRCEKDDLLVTLQVDDDPNEVLDELIAVRVDPISNKPLRRGNKPTTFAQGGRVYYDVMSKLETEIDSKNTPTLSAPAF